MVVELDIRILVLFCALASLVQGGLSLLFSSYLPNTHALRSVGFSTIVMAVAFVGMSAQGIIPDVISVVIAHGLAGITTLLFDRGVRVFQHEKTADPFGWGVVGCVTVGVAGLLAQTDELRPRIVLLSISGVILLTRVALRLTRGARKSGMPAHRITANIFWLFAGVMAVRGTAVLVAPAQSASPDLLQVLMLPAGILLLSAATLGFWSMEVQRLHSELTKLASTDEMTGALNRRAFLAQCERHLARRSRSREPISLVLFDLDHFKWVNDTYGHPAGDEVLRQAVRLLELAVRPGDTVGRFGGEEFAVLLPGADTGQAAEVAERAGQAIAAAAFRVGDHRIPVTTSAGVAALPLHSSDLSALIHASDAALYAAKAAGRNCVRVVETHGQALAASGAPGVVAQGLHPR